MEFEFDDAGAAASAGRGDDAPPLAPPSTVHLGRERAGAPGYDDDDDDDGGGDEAASDEPAAEHDERVARLCAALFQWLCVNCTRHNDLAHPSEELLTYAAAVDARLVAQRELTTARVAYSARLREYHAAVEARRAAVGSDGGVAAVVDVDVDVTAAGGAAGGVAHAHVHVHVGSSASARAPRDALAAVAAAAAGVTARPPLQPVQSAGEEPPEAPVPPDFEALAAALPAVPAPPTVPRELLLAQACDDCGAPYCDASPSANSDVVAALEVAAAHARARGGEQQLLQAAGELRSDEAVPSAPAAAEAAARTPHPLSAAASAPAAVAGGRGACRVVPSTNMSLLGITLQDEDPDEYIARYGLTAETIGAILRQPGCAAGGCGGGSEPRSLHAQRRAAHPLLQRFEDGVGGFAPVTGLAYDDRMLLHEEVCRPSRGGGAGGGGLRLAIPGVELPPPPAGTHPERPDRLRAIAQHLVATGLLQRCKRLACRPVEDAELAGVHEGDYRAMINSLDRLVDTGGGELHFGSDTFANAHSLTAARLACGSVLAVTESTLSGAVDRAVALVRPPGHHAEPDTAMGFCIYNNVAVAAWAATRKLGAQRVLIVDWDVHHGNGTQHMFEDDPSVLYVSLHRYDRGSFYPGTGGVEEVGTGRGAGYNINIPWDGSGAGDAEYAAAFDDVIMPVAHAYAPDLVLVSAGFDAARGDPLGGCDLTPAGYAYMTSRLLSLAGGRLVVALEGGYNLTSISRGMEAVLRVMLGQAPPPLHALPSRTHTGGGGPAAAASTTAAATRAYLDAIAARAHGAGGGSNPATAAAAAGAGAGAGSAAAAAGSSSSSSLPPRADTFEPTTLTVAEMESSTEGLDRAGILQQAAPTSSALRAIASALAAHAPYWPVLQAKHRAYQRLVHAELIAARAAVPGAGIASGSSDEDGGHGEDDGGSGKDEDEEQDDDGGGAPHEEDGNRVSTQDSDGDEEGDEIVDEDVDEGGVAHAVKRARTGQ